MRTVQEILHNILLQNDDNWEIVSVDCNDDTEEIHIELRYCQPDIVVDGVHYSIYDHRALREWRHLDLWQYETGAVVDATEGRKDEDVNSLCEKALSEEQRMQVETVCTDMWEGFIITEIVRRLYNNPEMRRQIPDDRERIQHILRHQVYGFAPTRIIYLIATRYILGFDPSFRPEQSNFRQVDTVPFAKEGKMEELIEREFGTSIRQRRDI